MKVKLKNFEKQLIKNKIHQSKQTISLVSNKRPQKAKAYLSNN